MVGMEQTVASGILSLVSEPLGPVWGHLREGQGLPIALSVCFPCSPHPPRASLGKPSQVASLPASGHQVSLTTSQNLPGKLPTPVILP